VFDSGSFNLVVLFLALAALGVLATSRVVARLRIPLPIIVLAASAAAVKLLPQVRPQSVTSVGRVVTLALIVLLFHGGMSMGWGRMRSSLAPIAVTGVIGTFLTTCAAAALVHEAWGFSWYVAALVGTAVAPTDPAVVFSVLGGQQIEGRSATIVQGESGANDPVGIALMAGLIGGRGVSAASLGHVALTFGLQMGIGGLVGYVGGRALLELMRRLRLPAEGLYPLRTLASAFALYGVASVAHGSGFLAVFVAGIVIGDERVPYKQEIERFHDAVGSLGEIVAFVALGLTVNVDELAQSDVLVPGLVLGLVLTILIRPLLVGACLLRARLRANELSFVLFAGLKGAVPILLAGNLVIAHVPQAQRLYGVVVDVVVFSVVVQGGLTTTVARGLRLPLRRVEPEPWSYGVRLRAEPSNVHRVTVAPGSRADGATLSSLQGLPRDAWVSLVVREGELVPVRGGTRLRAGDTLNVIAPGAERDTLAATFDTTERP
jgi:cell volume regulation protein A